jgi:hypothetical protein
MHVYSAASGVPSGRIRSLHDYVITRVILIIGLPLSNHRNQISKTELNSGHPVEFRARE